MGKFAANAVDRAAFVREIVSDPKAVPDVTLLYGYLGASSEEGHERLYLSPDLTNYVEVPTSAVLHQMPAPKEQDPHGGVTLWVKKDAALVYKMAPAAEALAHYFAGAIAGGAAPDPQPAALGAPNLAVQTLHPHVCTVQCNTRHPYCGTVTPACSYGASCWCLPPAAAAMAAAGPQLAALDAPNFAAQTLHPHVCTVQCNTRHPYCGTVTPACSYGASCWCLPPAAAAMAAAGPQLAALDAPNFAAQTLHPHVCTVQCNTRHPYCGTVTPACSYGASCWCLPPAAAAMAAAGPQLAALDAPNFAAQTLHPHVCTVQCNTRHPYCGTVTPACSYGASCWCLPPAAAAMAAAGPQLAAAGGTFHTPCCPILTYHSVCCPVSPFCPGPTAFCPGSLACPGSIACGLGQQVPGQQAAFAMARGASAFCTPGCSPVCTGVQCNTPAHPCTPHCPM